MLQQVMTKPEGRSLILFYINGRPDGMVTAEVFNWTGHVLTIPRTQLKEGLARKETAHTGVYLLWGEEEEGSCSYIGEAEDVSQRIRNHAVSVDWWTDAAVVTTSANNLNKAHVQYLESRLIEIANRIGRANLKNSIAPAQPSLSEADRANMEGFLENILLVLPSLGIDWFIDDTRPDPAPDTSVGGSREGDSPTFVLQIPKDDTHYATARIEDGKFVVQKDSQSRLEWVGTGHSSYRDLFNHLCDTEILKLAEDGSYRVFTENYAFNSTSAAGAVVTGRTCRGPEEWKTDDDGKTYAKWEKETLQPEKPESEYLKSEE